MSSRTKQIDEPEPNRRGLFTGFAKRANSITVHHDEKVLRTQPRPPTAVDEDIFQRLCNQCGECALACPESIIRMENGYPTLDVEYSHCTLCGECQSACPTIALSGTQQDTGLRANVADTCINLYGYCDAFRQSCSTQAIEWKDNASPRIRVDQCTGCGACKPDCFIGAIYMV
ncbi:4Fe-4S binding protein [Vibrio rumoiensis]|uniref:Ferredoxin-type protein NapF n=1 Tax=Vibrio rumoiensis 1S-45 TaxID=1188252 RepID=A0A1E5E2M5_9VIBR|nr:4Fe-4S binding protein [Vibrio rumoiensis]OEF25738.1 ferredoxin-type protein NapF [Vibrio rumoiensis 1S-45]